jgi:hypothetical protein
LLILNTDQPLKFLKPNLHYQLQWQTKTVKSSNNWFR